MQHLLQPTIILLLFVLVRAADLAISAGLARETIRTIAYSAVALLALVVVILALV